MSKEKGSRGTVVSFTAVLAGNRLTSDQISRRLSTYQSKHKDCSSIQEIKSRKSFNPNNIHAKYDKAIVVEEREKEEEEREEEKEEEEEGEEEFAEEEQNQFEYFMV
jgi:hypothetical protein